MIALGLQGMVGGANDGGASDGGAKAQIPVIVRTLVGGLGA